MLLSIEICALTVCRLPSCCSPRSLLGIVEKRIFSQLRQLASDSGESPVVVGYTSEKAADRFVNVV